MNALGKLVKRKTDKSLWRVVGVGPIEGTYALQPVEHGETISVTPAELRKQFGLTHAETPQQADAQTGWSQLSDRFKRSSFASVRSRSVEAPTPEQVFSGDDQAQIEQWAQDIWTDEERLAEFEIGLFTPHPAVEARVNQLLAQRNSGRRD